MSEKIWVITDVAQGRWLPEFLWPQGPESGPSPDSNGQGNASVRRRTLRGGPSEGVDVIEIDNGRLSVSVLPSRGMGIWRGSFEGIPLGWASPVSMPVHPSLVNLTERGGLGWLSGFNELLCRCGLESNGPPGVDIIPNNQGTPTQTALTLHGRIANIPAHYVEVRIDSEEPGKIAVTGIVDETLLFGPRLRLRSTVETTVGSNQLTVIDEITNLRASPAEFQLLYHTNFGPPFLEQDARFVAPIIEVAPRDGEAVKGIDEFARFRAPTTGFVEQVYFFDLAADAQGETLALLRNAAGDKGVSLHFNKQQLPCFSLWKNEQAEADGYVTGLEPATNFPNLKTFERQQGRVVTLQPGETYQTRLELQVHHTAEAVKRIESQIGTLQQSHTPTVHCEPQSKYSG